MGILCADCGEAVTLLESHHESLQNKLALCRQTEDHAQRQGGNVKIIVRAPNWLGDAIMCAPFLKRLAEKNPPAEIHVQCRASLQELFRGASGVAGVIPYSSDEPLFSRVRNLRAGKFDAGYILPPSFSSALLFALAGIPERIGYAADGRRFLLTRSFQMDERYHYVRRYLGLLEEPGRRVSSDELYFPKPVHPQDSLDEFLSAQQIPFRTPLLAVAPGSRAPARRWSSQRFASLINRLNPDDFPSVFILGANEDIAVAQEVVEHVQRPVINLCGKTNLVTLGDILRRASALVTNESGLMHVAWAVGTPTVVLAGPSNTRLTSPFGARVKILQHTEVPCVPCVKNECFRPGSDYKECMDRLTVEEAHAALHALTRPSAPALVSQ